MFSLIEEVLHDSPEDVLSELAAITQALSYGFGSGGEEDPVARHGFGVITAAVSRALTELQPLVHHQTAPYRAQKLAELEARRPNVSARPTGSRDLTEPAAEASRRTPAARVASAG